MTSLCSIRSPDWLSHSSVSTISPDHLAQRITKSTNRDTRASSLRRRASQSSRFDIACVALRHCFGDFHVARRGRAENSGDAVPDFFPENHRQDGDANDEEESDAVLGHQEGEAVRQVELCQVHVDGVGGHEDDGEPEDDGPVRT